MKITDWIKEYCLELFVAGAILATLIFMIAVIGINFRYGWGI